MSDKSIGIRIPRGLARKSQVSPAVAQTATPVVQETAVPAEVTMPAPAAEIPAPAPVPTPAPEKELPEVKLDAIGNKVNLTSVPTTATPEVAPEPVVESTLTVAPAVTPTAPKNVPNNQKAKNKNQKNQKNQNNNTVVTKDLSQLPRITKVPAAPATVSATTVANATASTTEVVRNENTAVVTGFAKGDRVYLSTGTKMISTEFVLGDLELNVGDVVELNRLKNGASIITKVLRNIDLTDINSTLKQKNTMNVNEMILDMNDLMEANGNLDVEAAFDALWDRNNMNGTELVIIGRNQVYAWGEVPAA